MASMEKITKERKHDIMQSVDGRMAAHDDNMSKMQQQLDLMQVKWEASQKGVGSAPVDVASSGGATPQRPAKKARGDSSWIRGSSAPPQEAAEEPNNEKKKSFGIFVGGFLRPVATHMREQLWDAA